MRQIHPGHLDLQRPKIVSRQPLEPAKQHPSFISLLSNKIKTILSNKIKTIFQGSNEPNNIDEDQTNYSELSRKMPQSRSTKDLMEFLETKDQKLNDQQRSTWSSSYRFSTYSNEQNQSANHLITQLQHFRKVLDLSHEDIKDQNKVKKRFSQLINSNQIKIYKFFTSEQKKQRKQKISQILISYFHICNFIFQVTYTSKQVELIEAIYKGKLQKVENLLNEPTNSKLINFKMKNTGYNLLYIASMSGHSNLTEYFLKQKEFLDIKNGQSTPMNVASWCGHTEIVELLLDYGMSPNVKNAQHNTADQETQNPELVALLSDVNGYRLKKILSLPLNADEKELIITIIEGKKNIYSLKKIIEKNKSLLNFRSNYQNFSLLSIAIMSKNLMAVKFILKTGCYFDITTCITTPMHLAVQSENPEMIILLLTYGLPHKIPDRYGYLPINLIKLLQKDELTQKKKELNFNSEPKPKTRAQKRQQIYNFLEQANKFKANKLIQELAQMGQLICVINIFDDHNNFVGRKLITKNYLKAFHDYQYKDAFHGTNFENLCSIIQHGLKKPGTKAGNKLIETKTGNIPLNCQYNGKKNWADAIFTTPSIYYACQYSQVESSPDIQSPDVVRWKSIVQVKVEKETFSQQPQTTGNDYQLVFDEPERLEYVTKLKDGQKDKVTVVAIILMDQKFYQNRLEKTTKHRKFSYKEITELFLKSKDEKIIEKYRQVQKARQYKQTVKKK